MEMLKKIVYAVCCRFLFRVEYINKPSLEDENGHVICANHIEWIDAVSLWTKTKNAAVMAKAELFKVPIWSNILRAAGAFPIKRGQKDFGSMFYATKEVAAGNNLIIFPEGTRKAKQKNVKPKIGAIYIAIATGADIIPVYIQENVKLFGKIEIIYGKPYNLGQYKDRIKDKNLLRELTDELMSKIYSLGNNE